MKRSDGRILTSHAGSLPRPEALLEVNRPKLAGEAYDEKVYAKRLSAAVEEVGRNQAELGIDVINDGEFGKASFGVIDYGAWSSYAWARLRGWEPGEPGLLPALAGRRDRARFAEFYAELDASGFRSSSSLGGRPPVFTGPIAYVGHQAVRADLTNFKAALAKVTADEGFITAVAPGSFASAAEPVLRALDEAFLTPSPRPLREEYKAIVEAGFVLQLDDPGLPDTWDMANPEPSVADYQKVCDTAGRSAEPRAARPPGGPDPLSHLLGQLARPHTTDLPLKKYRRRDVASTGRGVLDRGRQRPSRARVEGLAGCQAARREDPDSRVSSATPPTSSSIPRSSPTASSISPGSRGARTSLPARIVASAAEFIRSSSGPSSKRSSPAPGSRPTNCGRKTSG